MCYFELDGKILRKMIISGARELDLNRDFVDSLNVFPVPDGDTGTNMSLTVLSAANEIENMDSNNISVIAKAAAMGALKGARGNSGVILSQLFRGFAKELENISVATKNDLARACTRASEMAYKAVMKPKEGTILTMAREIAQKFSKEIKEISDKKNKKFDKKDKDLEKILFDTIIYGKKVLDKTRDMLSQLKQANVVDSGACGLLFVLEGAVKALNNKLVFESYKNNKNGSQDMSAQNLFKTNDIEFSYEILLDIKNSEQDKNKLDIYKEFLSKIGDSLVVSEANDFTRIHVHTNQVSKAIEKAMDFWPLLNIRLENLKNQHEEILDKDKVDKNKQEQKISDRDKNKNDKSCQEKTKKFGFISVSVGDGFNDLFKNLGVDEIINGGQSMNPSTKDILDAIEKINAENIIILPNNKNIILTAQQAAELYNKNNKHNIIVLPTKNIPQGLSVMLNYMPDEKDIRDIKDINKNINQMQDAIKSVKTGQVTYAVRDTQIDNKKILKNDILCMNEDKIILIEKNLDIAVKNLIDKMLESGGDVLTIYFGIDVDKTDAQKIFDYARKKYIDTEIEIHSGGQPLYYYIISVE